ncbi:50S ribosomal protein L31 [Candidatus Uhrbacteria bacterium CG_4_9_14_3_um_filter_36_7]|uniref:Large ribosomal subunit protein bL31 n=1 Tax=Candidatus Uhrbacteria bacterium CG_4_9_14_3_um_filter_36_7 TaxID=1975033 RepID=A0A2M7XIA6_9BACT|nr:MAG: 50S ribosomal protein L31 [Candidatus Uhrbacteria bacterium CG_4_9_14_3_um_filter_36_7]
MKKTIHPTYFKDATITCACGAIYHVGSTLQEISVELCAKCHPFYTGKQKILDTARRVEKFEERLSKKSISQTGKKIKREKRAVTKNQKQPKVINESPKKNKTSK